MRNDYMYWQTVDDNDGEVDYPYDYDDRGFHLFGQWHLTEHWYLSVGHYDISEVAGAGRNRSTYGLVGYRRQGSGWLQRIFLENNSRRVQDDIADEFMESDDDAVARDTLFGSCGVQYFPDAPLGQGIVKFLSFDFKPDLLFYQDSYVNKSYLEGHARLGSGLDLVQQFRLRFNWQQGGKLRRGPFQPKRRLDFWTSITRVQYSLQFGKLSFTPQYKLMLLRLQDQERNVWLHRVQAAHLDP